MQTKFLFPSIILLWLFCGCNTNSNNSLPKYEVLKEEKFESSSKAQIQTFAVYNDTMYTKELLKKVMEDIYNKTKNKNIFENHNAPTVVGAYVYTSKEMAENDKGAWIAMFTKGPNDKEPNYLYMDIKINSLQGLSDTLISANETNLNSLNSYLKERNLDLCVLYKQLSDLELECIQKAEEKVPDFGKKHLEYSDKLMEEGRQKLMLNYNLADSIFNEVVVYGISYCK